MAQGYFTPGDTGLQVRTVIDSNFTELYERVFSGLRIEDYVSTFADLPPFADHSGEFWWVLTGTGSTILLNRKDAGLYRSDGAKWVFSSVQVEYYLTDASFRLSEDIDSTKQMQFQLDQISTGTTRTLTIPDQSGIVALTSDLTSYVKVDGTQATEVDLGGQDLSNVGSGSFGNNLNIQRNNNLGSVDFTVLNSGTGSQSRARIIAQNDLGGDAFIFSNSSGYTGVVGWTNKAIIGSGKLGGRRTAWDRAFGELPGLSGQFRRRTLGRPVPAAGQGPSLSEVRRLAEARDDLVRATLFPHGATQGVASQPRGGSVPGHGILPRGQPRQHPASGRETGGRATGDY